MVEPDPVPDEPTTTLGLFFGFNRPTRIIAAAQLVGFAVAAVAWTWGPDWPSAVDLGVYVAGVAVILVSVAMGFQHRFVGPLLGPVLLLFLQMLAITFLLLIWDTLQFRRRLEPSATSPTLTGDNRPSS